MKRLCIQVALISAAMMSNPAWAQAQSSPAAIPGATLLNVDPQEGSKYLGTSYKKEADGFRFTPPAGAKLIGRQGVDLISFVVEAKSWGGSLQRIVAEKPAEVKPGAPAIPSIPMTLQEYVNKTKADVAKDPKDGGTFRGVQLLEEKAIKVGKFDAVRLSFAMQADVSSAAKGSPQNVAAGGAGASLSIYRQELIVKFKEGVYMVLTFYTPLSDREVATRTWEMMIPELEIYDPAAILKRRVDAAKAAKDWLGQHSADEFKSKLINQGQYFRSVVGGKDVGYFRFDETTKEVDPKTKALVDVERDKHKGILILVNFRSFPDAVTVSYGQNEAFWGYAKDGQGQPLPDYSSWSNLSKIKTKVPFTPRGGQTTIKEVIPWVQEAGILAQTGQPGKDVPYQMVVNLTGDTSQSLPPATNVLIPLNAAPPLPRALDYIWTRMVDLTKPSEMTFTVFDSQSRKMGTRNLIVTGRKENVMIDGRSESCYKCVDENDPNSTTIWTDSTGKVRMMKTNDQSVMIPTTEAAMLEKWASRLNDQ